MQGRRCGGKRVVRLPRAADGNKMRGKTNNLNKNFDFLHSRNFKLFSQIEAKPISKISGFRHDVDELCALLGYYAASSGNPLPTFRDNVSLPYSRSPRKNSPLKMVPKHCPETSVKGYHSTLRNILEECKSLGLLTLKVGTDTLSRNVGTG
jgi:hypothetical protein